MAQRPFFQSSGHLTGLHLIEWAGLVNALTERASDHVDLRSSQARLSRKKGESVGARKITQEGGTSYACILVLN